MGLFIAVHEPTDPEYSILKQRLARRLKQEGVDEANAKSLDLVELTKVGIHANVIVAALLLHS